MSNLDEFECSICARTFEDPVRTECNHTFCKTCCNCAGSNCAMCRELIRPGSVQRALDLIKRMETNERECPNCKQKMKIKDLRRHDETAHPNPQIQQDVRPRTRRSAQVSDSSTRRSSRTSHRSQHSMRDYGFDDAVVSAGDLTHPTDETSIDFGNPPNTSARVVAPMNARRIARRNNPNPYHPTRQQLLQESTVEPTDMAGVASATGVQRRGRNERARNWYLYECPYECGAVNLDREGLLNHCISNHAQDPNQQRVCTICASLPYGNDTQRSGNLHQHLNLRHKADLDMYTDFSLDDDQALTQAVNKSLQDY